MRQTDMSDERQNTSVWSAPIDVAGWWKLVIAGPVIIFAVVIAAGFGVEAWFVGVVAVIFGAMLFALGSVLGFVYLVARRSS